MSNGWDQADAPLKKHANPGSGLFVKLAGNGDKIVGAPFPREVHWTAERYDECAGDGCGHCSKGDGAKLRVAFNVYAPGDDEPKPPASGCPSSRRCPALDTFLGGLDIQRVRELAASDEKAARTLLQRLEADSEQEEDASILDLHHHTGRWDPTPFTRSSADLVDTAEGMGRLDDLGAPGSWNRGHPPDPSR